MKKKVFISDLELKKMAAREGAGFKLPEGAIISPLAADWLGGLSRSGDEPGLRRQIAQIGKRLYALGFVPASDGNISVRCRDGSILITPSGVCKGGLEPSDISRISPAGELLSGRRPSSEYKLHLCVYGLRPEVEAVIHAHPPLSTGFACSGMALDLPLTSEMVITLGKVPLAQYATPGTDEVGESITGLIKDHNALLLANHGVLTCGKDLETAFQRMETVEQSAKITLVTEILGGGKPIEPEKLEKLREIRLRLGF